MIVPHPFRLHAFERIDSTNEEARRLAADGAPEFTLVVAAEQSSGRGRRGRAWQSPAGNLYCSLLLRPSSSAADAAQLGFAASLAAAETVEHFLPEARTHPLEPFDRHPRESGEHSPVAPAKAGAQDNGTSLALGSRLRGNDDLEQSGSHAAEISLKWPNDVLLGGKKLAGILLESRAAGDGLDYLVIGVGMNLASHPDDTPYPATSLAAWGAQVTPEAALPILGARILAWYEAWQNGFAPLRAAWLARAEGLGAAIRVRLPDGEIEGRFDGLDEAGRLLLTTPGGRRAIAAGEVFPAA
jgi:BirA family transcriptional regulator, biotin operon repressor / biotin---[acetyl-CoA-carboxylase] ligase